MTISYTIFIIKHIHIYFNYLFSFPPSMECVFCVFEIGHFLVDLKLYWRFRGLFSNPSILGKMLFFGLTGVLKGGGWHFTPPWNLLVNFPSRF